MVSAFWFPPISDDAKLIWSGPGMIIAMEQIFWPNKKNPKLIFKDFRFYALAVQVLSREIEELHQIALCLDHNQADFYKRLENIALKWL